jgi:hypothetical protein
MQQACDFSGILGAKFMGVNCRQPSGRHKMIPKRVPIAAIMFVF